MNKVIDMFKEAYGIEIVDKCNENLILFQVEPLINQSFRFGITIYFSGITGQEQFKANIPALDLGSKDLSGFSNEVIKVYSIIATLNNEIHKRR
ncbi:hypothetical protein D3C71_1116420 [compost metagenome]